jgi:manganese efflux pump family protein
MNFGMTFVLALGLSLDAAAVAVATSVRLRVIRTGQVLRMAASFGFFQFFMPLLGKFLGETLAGKIQQADHWVAFGLLVLVGGHMLWEAWHAKSEVPGPKDPTRGWTLWILSIATSIDALAVGLSLSLLRLQVLVPAMVIGVVTALLTALGLLLGARLGQAFDRKMDLVGGLVLIGLGVKILFEHLR